MAHCDEALDRIGKAIKEYRKENDGVNPESLMQMVDLEMITLWDLVCPASPYAVGDCSYEYRGEDLNGKSPAEMIVAYDKQPNHKGRRNVLYANGHVKRPPEKIFDMQIRKDNEFREIFKMDIKEL